jgi:hypothetical protein
MFTALTLYLSGQVSGDGTDGTTGKWKYSQSIGHQSLPGEFFSLEAFYGNLKMHSLLT